MSEPIRHHFIPQFILRNFSSNEDRIFYWNKESNQVETRNTKSVYMIKNLYRDEHNHPTDPAIIEKKFANLESTIATLFREKIMNKESIELTRTDNETLRKFLFLLSFRSSTRKQQYIDANFDEMTKMSLDKYVSNGDYVDLWLREILTILDLENYQDIENNEAVSWTIRTDFMLHLSSYYMTFVTPRGQDFILCDIYPTAEIYPVGFSGANLYPHFLFPISPNLMLLLNHVAFRPDVPPGLPMTNNMVKLSRIKGNAIVPPHPHYVVNGAFNKGDSYSYKVQKIYSEDVVYLNALMLNETRHGFSFKDVSRIAHSLERYQTNEQTRAHNKNDYSEFLNNIE